MDTQAIDDLKFISKIREQMDENKLMLSYRGEMSQDIVLALLNLTENNLNLSESNNTLKSRVFYVMVECLQNITQHSEKDKHSKSNMFMIGQSDNGFTIFSGNVVKMEKVQELKSKILKINTMSEDELKKLFKYWIKNGSLSQKTGFGLGLIQIARKTGNPLDFDFEPIDSDNCFFSLRTTVDH